MAEFDYDAFGNSRGIAEGNGKNNKKWSTYRFSSKEFEDHAGLYYFGARYYDPEIGRWLTPDPLGFIDGENAYVYTRNNPVNRIDSWGFDSYIISRFGHQYVVIDDPEKPGYKIAFDFYPDDELLKGLIKPVQGVVREQILSPGQEIPFSFEIPFLRKEQGKEEDLIMISKARNFIRWVDEKGYVNILNEPFYVNKNLCCEYVWSTISTKDQTLTMYYQAYEETPRELVKTLEYKLREPVKKRIPIKQFC